MDRPRTVTLRRLSLALVLTVGCTKESSEQIKDALEETIKEQLRKDEGGAVGEVTSDLATQPELLANKLGLYLECANASQTQVREHFAAYSDGVGEDGALRVGRARPGALSAAVVERCQKAMKEGPHLQPPQPELEAAQRAFTEALGAYQAQAVAFAELAAAAPAKGKIDAAIQEQARALQGPMTAAYARWQEAAAAFVREMDATQGRVDAATLARIERAGGKTLEYHARAFVIRSRPLVQSLNAGADLPRFEAAYFDLEQAHDELKGYLGEHEAEAQATFWFDHFVESADEYYAAAGAFLEEQRAGAAGQAPKAASAAVLREFNDLLRDVAQLRFKADASGGAGKAAARDPAPTSSGGAG